MIASVRLLHLFYPGSYSPSSFLLSLLLPPFLQQHAAVDCIVDRTVDTKYHYIPFIYNSTQQQLNSSLYIN